MKKKMIALLMTLGLIVGFQTNPANAASKKAYIQTGVKSKVTVLCRKTLDLKAKTVNVNKKITYTSSKPSVASVNANGIVRAKKYGTTVITMKASGLSAKKVTISVRKPVTSMKLKSKSKVKLKKGKTSKISVQVLPGGKQMVSTKLSYKSSNTKVATVSSKGKIKAKSGGYAKITVSTPKSSGKICKKYQLGIGSGLGENSIYIEKIAKNEVRFELLDTNESYDAKLDSKRYQLTFYKNLKDSNGKWKVTFDVNK